jgi:hypothetical protein
MKRVRDCRRRARICVGMRLCVSDAAGIFERVGQVVVGRDAAECERLLKERNGRLNAALAAIGRIGRLRDPSEDQQLNVLRRFGECLVEGSSISRQFRLVGRRGFSFGLCNAGGDVQPVVLACLRRQSACSLQCGSGRRRLIQLGLGNRQPDMGHREPLIESERLIEGTRGLNPDEAMQICEPLVVVRLRVFRRGEDRVVGATDIGAERQRAVQEFGGNDRNWMRVGRLGSLRAERCYATGTKRPAPRDESAAND